MWSITLPIVSNSITVKHTASGVTIHQNMFGVRFDPIRPDELVNVSGLMRVNKITNPNMFHSLDTVIRARRTVGYVNVMLLRSQASGKLG